MINLSKIAKELSGSNLSKNINIAQQNRESEVFFTINMNKENIFLKKKNYFKNKEFSKFILIYDEKNYFNVANNINKYDVTKIKVSEFLTNETDTLIKHLNNALILLNSNLFFQIGIERLSNIYEVSPNSIWAIQDYDNHHWIENSIEAAIFADIYFPCHMDGDIGLLARINPNIPCILPCGSNQWSEKFITLNSNSLINSNRSNSPLGKYYFYEKFIHRNKMINTLNEFYKTISILENDFHLLSDQQKWDEWVSHKFHWIIPTANDIPIRFFDSLITGGIPIVPKSLVPFLNFLNIPNNYYVTFRSTDIFQPNKLIETLNDLIREDNQEALKRHQFAMNHFHIDSIVNKVRLTVNSLVNN